jgi:hypothetical protein
MIKYLGSVGTFIRLNDNDNKTYDLLNVYSSSAARLLLFSTEVNNSTGLVSFDSASTSLYINGVSGSVIPNQQWAHITFSFDDRLATYDINDFLIKFGGADSGNFNIQNFYYTQSSLPEETVGYIHQEFTGGYTQKLVVEDTLPSINVIDRQENSYTSNSTGTIYHGLNNQKRFLDDLTVAADYSLETFISASVMGGDDLHIDGYNIVAGDRLLSFTDNQIYELTASAQLIPVSSSPGDFVRITAGQEYGESYFINTESGFQRTPFALKINTILNFIE